MTSDTTPLQKIGFWSGLRRVAEPGADPTKLVDAGWAGVERAQLAQFLRRGHVWTSSFGYSYCRFACGIPDSDLGTATLTDGTWAWPEGLPHYLEAHQVCLPDEFLDHARALGFKPPGSEAIKPMFAAAVLAARNGLPQPIVATFWEQWARQRQAWQAP